jgi:hypothetical protein
MTINSNTKSPVRKKTREERFLEKAVGNQEF